MDKLMEEERYKNAQAAHKRFFGRESKYNFEIQNFLTRYNSTRSSFLDLTGYPSRSRIMLIAEMTKKLQTEITVTYIGTEDLNTTDVYESGIPRIA
jgi:hypothetical protein